MAKSAHASGSVPPSTSIPFVVANAGCGGSGKATSAIQSCFQAYYISWYPDMACYTVPPTIPTEVPSYFTVDTFCSGFWHTQHVWVVAGGCPDNSTGNNTIKTSPPTSCTCNDPYVPDSAKTSCVQDQFTLKVIQDQQNTVEPGASKEVLVRVENAKQDPESEVMVKLKVDVDETSGGHAHGGPGRDKGSLSGAACDPPEKNCATATTGPNGYASFTFKAPAVSGKHTVTAACISPVCNNTDTGKIDVKVPGLHTIPDDPALYVLIGGEANKKHHDNHYLTSSALDQLFVLAINYHVRYPNEPVLHLNDASLVWGGKFDINGNWVGYHKGHKQGVAIDIRANTADGHIPESLFDDFKNLAAGTKTIVNGRVKSAVTKVHCSAGRDPAIDNCVGDDNRHFHVNLLGVDK